MMIITRQISSLEKVGFDHMLDCDEITRTTVLRGERYSYQVAVKTERHVQARVSVTSPIIECVKTYAVRNAVMDRNVTVPDGFNDIDYITKDPGLMPDILEPVEDNNNMWMVWPDARSLWIEVNIPEDFKPGEYEIRTVVTHADTGDVIADKTMTIEVLDKVTLPQELIYMRATHIDCIADYHNVEVYSERHWELIEAYLKEAIDVGINVVCVPLHTPPVDIAVGSVRTCVQLVDIKYEDGKYTFGFDKLKRFLQLSKKCGAKYFEMVSMFSQWGADCAPNILVEENGEKTFKFGWHVSATAPEYVDFLKQYLPAIVGVLREEGVEENTFFSISDEPNEEQYDKYRAASDLLRPLLGNTKSFDAVSKYKFYETGLVEYPVTQLDNLDDVLPHKIPTQWVYYCCFPQYLYTNSFLAYTSQRVRILGVLLYKYNLKGFCHWATNFYNSALSRYHINPYTTTSAEGTYPSGDPFILYPTKNGCIPSIRGKVTYDAIGDLNLCRTLEQYIGRDAVVKMIDEVAGFDVTFKEYPRHKNYLLDLREKMIEALRKI